MDPHLRWWPSGNADKTLPWLPCTLGDTHLDWVDFRPGGVSVVSTCMKAAARGTTALEDQAAPHSSPSQETVPGLLSPAAPTGRGQFAMRDKSSRSETLLLWTLQQALHTVQCATQPQVRRRLGSHVASLQMNEKGKTSFKRTALTAPVRAKRKLNNNIRIKLQT